MSQTLPLQVGMEPYPGCKLRQPLGKGGFAEVWEGEEAKGRLLALKFIPSREDMSTSREIQAIQAVRKLKHPGLIEIENVMMNWGYIIVAMEVAEGSLTDLLEAYKEEFQAPIVPEQVCMYLAQVAEALDFLHDRNHLVEGQKVGWQHCDIKPSNMLLFGETVKLADFGLSSKMVGKRMPHRRAGTMDYAAPEVFRGELTDQTDQYALAVTYCLLRGGKVPFPDSPQKFDASYVRPEPDLAMLSEPERPIIATISRLVAQKGYDLIRDAARGILDTGAFFIALGTGAKEYEDFLQSWHDAAPHRVGIYKGFAGEPLAHQIEAGADIFLMPSLYEPCGLNQMYSMRYGTVPVVRATGGLDDTVENFDRSTATGNGFKFGPYSAAAMLEKIGEAIYLYNEPETWKKIQLNGMSTDNSWSAAAKRYIELYNQISGPQN